MPILTDEERVGTTIADKYRLVRIIGRGGMGTVFDSVHTLTGRRVAVKLLRAEYAREREVVRRFFQEARAAAALNHPNVVDVLDLGELPDGGAYLVLELLQGEPLSGRLERVRRLAPGAALACVMPVMRALAAAHANGVVHRDIKPDNVFLHRGGAPDGSESTVVKLLDFGVAKVIDSTRSQATATGVVVGTPYYMAPEQAEGRSDVGFACDVWSVGVMLYECLSGTLPYNASNPMGVLVAIMTKRPKPLSVIDPSLPPELCAIVDRAMRFAPEDRWPSMAAFHDALAEVHNALGLSGHEGGRVSLLNAGPYGPHPTPVHPDAATTDPSGGPIDTGPYGRSPRSNPQYDSGTDVGASAGAQPIEPRPAMQTAAGWERDTGRRAPRRKMLGVGAGVFALTFVLAGAAAVISRARTPQPQVRVTATGESAQPALSVRAAQPSAGIPQPSAPSAAPSGPGPALVAGANTAAPEASASARVASGPGRSRPSAQGRGAPSAGLGVAAAPSARARPSGEEAPRASAEPEQSPTAHARPSAQTGRAALTREW